MNMVIKTILIFSMFSIVSCQHSLPIAIKKSFGSMQTEVRQMMDSVVTGIAETGPGKWLDYFEDTSSFYMASEGKLVFPGYNAAKNFINDTLVHVITNVNLKWNNTHIDSISETTVAVNSAYHEDLTAANGNIMHEDGYCTAILDDTASGWKFRSLHWSASK